MLLLSFFLLFLWSLWWNERKKILFQFKKYVINLYISISLITSFPIPSPNPIWCVRKKRLSALCEQKFDKRKLKQCVRYVPVVPWEWKLKKIWRCDWKRKILPVFRPLQKKIFNIFYVIKRLYVLWRINLVAVSRNRIKY